MFIRLSLVISKQNNKWLQSNEDQNKNASFSE